VFAVPDEGPSLSLCHILGAFSYNYILQPLHNTIHECQLNEIFMQALDSVVIDR
jgi:hypothetical protein